MSKYHIPLHPDKCYHIFNHAVGDELLFRNEDNFEFFLKKHVLHNTSICHTLSYSLLPDHFHFVIKIKSLRECSAQFEQIKGIQLDCSRHNISDFLMERFSNWCNSYTKSYNKVFSRKGALFIDYLQRREVSDHTYLRNVINYIHFNAVYHRYCKKPLEWKWSSFHTVLARGKTRINRKEILDLFGGADQFKIAHTTMVTPMREYEFL